MSFGVAEQGILVKKPFRIIRARFFDAGKLLQNLLESRTGVEPPPKVTNTHRSENHQTLQFSILLRLQNDLLKNVSCSRRFVFVCLLWGPFGSSRSLGKIATFGPATPTGRPNPAKPVLLLGNDPKSFCKFFPNFLRSPVCGLLRKIFKDFGIHPRLFKGTSLKVSTFL